MKKVICTTTIHPVTEAIRKFEAMPDWDLVIAGDLKTPADYASHLTRGIYLSPAWQEAYDKHLSDAIGWNCIQRRNFALLKAYEMGADVVAVVDDDNIPYDFWGKDLSIGKPTEVNFYTTDAPAFDPVGATNHRSLWHRGFPLQLIPERDYSQVMRKEMVPDVQADFWNGDPDVDAVCRMEHRPQCSFDDACFPFATGTLSPFNSQNTFISAKWLKDYFLFPHIGRMDDIWAAYYIEAKGAQVMYQRPSVFQLRNEHDPVKDMKMEYHGYENNLSLVKVLKQDPEAIRNFLPAQSVEAFERYRLHFR